MCNAISSIRDGLTSDEKVLVWGELDMLNPDYDNMGLDELLGEDNAPAEKSPDWDTVLHSRDMANSLNALLDTQESMEAVMDQIKAYRLVQVKYYVAKKRFDRAKEVMFSNDTPKPQKWWNKFNKLKNERNVAWKAAEAAYNQISSLWEQWFELRNSTYHFSGQVWAQYYQMKDNDLTKYFTYDGDVDDQDITEWFSAQDEIIRDTHIKEMSEYDVIVHLPVRTGGYVPPCRELVCDDYEDMGG